MNTSIITLRVNEELKIKLDNIAIEENRSLNNLINTILIEYIKNKEEENNTNKKTK